MTKDFLELLRAQISELEKQEEAILAQQKEELLSLRQQLNQYRRMLEVGLDSRKRYYTPKHVREKALELYKENKKASDVVDIIHKQDGVAITRGAIYSGAYDRKKKQKETPKKSAALSVIPKKSTSKKKSK